MSAIYKIESEHNKTYLLSDRKKSVSTSQNIVNYGELYNDSTSNVIFYVDFLVESKPRYEGLKNLIEEWLNEPGDYDIQVWPEIENQLKNQKINLRESFD